MTEPSAAGQPLDVDLLRRLLLVERLSYKQIARQVGSTDVTVAAVLRRHGVGPLKGQVQPGTSAAPADGVFVDARALASSYRAGASIRQLAADTGLSRERVTQRLRAGDVGLRGRGARPAERLDSTALRHAYEQGASLRELALRHRTDDRQVRQAVLRAGGVLRERGAPSRFTHLLTRAFLHDRYVRDGAGVAEIAAEVGCSVTTVRVALGRHGVRPADSGGRSNRSGLA